MMLHDTTDNARPSIEIARYETGDPHYRAVRRRYAAYAPIYDNRFARYTEATLHEAMSAIGPDAPGCLVDVATGTGVLPAMVVERWPEASIIGVDLSEEMLANARERLPERPAGGARGSIAWSRGTAESLPIQSAVADVLVCTNAFHLVREPERALAEFHRVLKPRGKLVLLDWCADYATMRTLVTALNHLGRHRRRVRREEELNAELAAADFAVESSRRFKVGVVWGLVLLTARPVNRERP